MELIHILATLFIAVAGFLVARRIGIPVPAMIGSMLAVGIVSAFTGFTEMPAPIKAISQGISGAFIGLSISRRDVRNVPHMIKPLILLITLLTVNTISLGIVFHVFFGWDLMTGLLSCVAGGIADVSLIAMDLDADASTVAIMQTLRLATVLAFLPSWVQFMTRNIDEEEDSGPSLDMSHVANPTVLDRFINTQGRKTAFTLIIALTCGAVGYASGIPAGSLVCSLIVVAALNIFTDACAMPMTIKRIAQVLAGSLVGSSVTPETISHLNTIVGPVIIMMAMYMIVNYTFSKIATKTGMLDMKSALFASSPGGASDMALIAGDLGADLAKIAVLQICRVIYASALMPQVAILVVRLMA
ncbi:MAG TPA: AbrB family transcriptional regulator [Collinsella ihuae]|uniref:AbrB family transcriptional regulator n=1 Tax=Collinsella ihumii TaxID=1720204 RepID=A0A921IRY4_9ACTN|nr:AbrB family transcriptional regulator [Collinsella ihumii]